MALVLKTNPVGIDFNVNQIQNRMFASLTNNGVGEWTIADYESYPRAYVNPKSGGTIPEVYTGNREYKEVLFDDKFNVTSFFLVDDSRVFDNTGGLLTQDVSIIFQANLKKLFPSITHRADEEMHKDIFDSLESASVQDKLTTIITGVSNVYSDLDIPASYTDRVGLDDMSDYHIVKIDLILPYEYCNK